MDHSRDPGTTVTVVQNGAPVRWLSETEPWRPRFIRAQHGVFVYGEFAGRGHVGLHGPSRVSPSNTRLFRSIYLFNKIYYHYY